MKSATKRRAAAILGGLATISMLSACTGGGASSAEGPVDLRMVVWTANEDHLALFDSIAEEYIAANPDKVASVTFDTVSGDYVSGLTTQVAGGDAPDLAWVAEANLPEFSKSGVLTDIKPALEGAPDYNFDDVLPNSLSLGEIDDKLFAYPFSNSPFGVYVNTALIEAAGQPSPRALLDSGDWTWDAAATVAAATAQAAGSGTGPLLPAQDPAGYWDVLTPMWVGWGAAPWSADGAKCTFDSPEMNDFYSWYHDQAYVKHGVPVPGEEFSFASGGAAMQVGQLSASGGFDPSVQWDFLPLPAGPEVQQSVIGQAGIGVIARGDHPDVASDFLAYFTDEQNAAKLAQFFPPPRESLLNVNTLATAAPKLNEVQIQGSVLDAIPDAVTKAGHPLYSQLNPLIKSGLADFWSPDADVAGVLDSVCADIAPLISGK